MGLWAGPHAEGSRASAAHDVCADQGSDRDGAHEVCGVALAGGADGARTCHSPSGASAATHQLHMAAVRNQW